MLLDHPSDEPTAIRTHIAAIFASLELSRSTWLVTSLSAGKGEKMSKHSVTAGNVAELLTLFAELRRKAEVRTGRSYPIITIQEAGWTASGCIVFCNRRGSRATWSIRPRSRRRGGGDAPRRTGSMARH